MKPAEKELFLKKVGDVQASFDREALRLNAFMTIAAGAIDALNVKFRARSWYCHAPFIRQVINLFSNKWGLQEVVWVFWATSEGWKHACEHLEPQIFLVA